MQDARRSPYSAAAAAAAPTTRPRTATQTTSVVKPRALRPCSVPPTAVITPVVVPAVPTPLANGAVGDESTEDSTSKTLAEIEAADWIIFVMLDLAPQPSPHSTAVKLSLIHISEPTSPY